MAVDRGKLMAELQELALQLRLYEQNPELRAGMDAKVRADYGFDSITADNYCLLRIEGIASLINRDGHELDNCQICKGQQGGERGNENIVDGITMCDYCSCAVARFKEFYEMQPK